MEEVERVKTSLWIRASLLRAVKILAAVTGKKDYQIDEEALAAYCGEEAVRANWARGGTAAEKDAVARAVEALRVAHNQPAR